MEGLRSRRLKGFRAPQVAVQVIFNSILTMDHMVSALESIDGNFLIKDGVTK